MKNGVKMKKLKKNGMKNGEKFIDRIKNKNGAINGKLIYQLVWKKEKIGDKITLKIIRLKNIGLKNGMTDILKMGEYLKKGMKSTDFFISNLI